METEVIHATTIGQYVRNGNSCFVLKPFDQSSLREIPAENCSREVCAVLALLQPGQRVELSFNAHQDMGVTVKLYRAARVL